MFINSSTKNIWGLSIEETCINAVKASSKGKKLLVEAFDTVNYSELGPGYTQQGEPKPKIHFKPFPIDKKEPVSETITHTTNIKGLADLAEKAITLFLSRNQISRSDKILIALPAQFILSRFINLPAVKKKELKNIVKFEVEKHIPVDSSDIIWDFHQLDNKPDPGKDTEVGIFAIKKEDVYTFLSSSQPLNDDLTTIQIGSLSLYNFLLFNEQEIHTTLLLEIGDNNTNLMIINNGKIWIRNIPSTDLGDNFIDEIKRSTGYYRSLVKELKIKYLIVTGVLSHQDDKKRFLSQRLGCELKDIALTENNIEVSKLVNSKSFNSNISRFIIPLGLTAQGLSLGRININLIPEEFVKKIVLSGKKKIAMLSSIIILTGVLILLLGEFIQNKRLLNVSNSGLETYNKTLNLERLYKKKEKTYNKIRKDLDQIALIGAGRTFWNKVIPEILIAMPEKSVLFSLMSDWITSPDLALSMSLKGKSFDPRLGFINEKIKTPLENIVWDNNGEEIHIFENVNVIPNSIKQDNEGISFEVKWAVKHKTFLLLSSNN